VGVGFNEDEVEFKSKTIRRNFHIKITGKSISKLIHKIGANQTFHFPFDGFMLKPLFYPFFMFIQKILRHELVDRFVDHFLFLEVEDVFAGGCDVCYDSYLVFVEDYL
jgi:hypothetical protein